MKQRETRDVGSFLTTDDAGNPHPITIRQLFIIDRNISGQPSEKPGIKSLMTEYGEHVIRVSDREYEIPASGLKLHSNDPARHITPSR